VGSGKDLLPRCGYQTLGAAAEKPTLAGERTSGETHKFQLERYIILFCKEPAWVRARLRSYLYPLTGDVTDCNRRLHCQAGGIHRAHSGLALDLLGVHEARCGRLRRGSCHLGLGFGHSLCH